MSKAAASLSGEMGGLIKIETITPAMARALLERDSRNRPLRPHTVQRYAADMSAGKWQLNGETIKVATNGEVLDGQHRLNACIESQTPFQTLIVYDLPLDTFRTIDSGKPRSLSDLLFLRGVGYSSVVAAAAPYVYIWDTTPRSKSVKSKLTGGLYRPSRNELFAWLEETDWQLWPTAASEARRVRTICPQSVACAANYIMSRTSHVRTLDFFEKFATGAGFSSEDDPISRLRSKLIRDRAKLIQAPPYDRFIWVMTAWLAYLENRPIQKLRTAEKHPGDLREAISEIVSDEHSVD